MCRSEMGDSGVLHAKNAKGVLERQWSRKKGYAMK